MAIKKETLDHLLAGRDPKEVMEWPAPLPASYARRSFRRRKGYGEDLCSWR